MDLSALFPAFFQALEPGMLGMVLLGTILGIVVGSLPGLTSTMGVALLVPFTFSMSPAMGLALLGAIYASSSYAGSISAILLNIPGTPSNCCTLLDGYPMTQKGQASRALALSTIGSAVGGILSVFALLFLAPPLARLALEFGSQEYFIMALFGVAIIAALSEKNIVKGMITGIFGLLLSIVGMHPITGEARFTFDLPELFNGLSLVTALIGLYSLPEVVSMLRDEKDAVKVESSVSCSGIIRAMREILKYKTKHTRIVNGIDKSHCADAFCIAGNLGAKRLGEFFFQKQTRRNNRQIHKLSILKHGLRKRNQAPFEVKGFRLFDKVVCQGEEGFIFGRRSSGSFDVRKLDGTRISAGISYKKLRLLEKRRTYLKEIRKEEALPPLPEGRSLRA